MIGGERALATGQGAIPNNVPRDAQSVRERLMRTLALLKHCHGSTDNIEASLVQVVNQPTAASPSAPGPYPVEVELSELEAGLESLAKRLDAIAGAL